MTQQAAVRLPTELRLVPRVLIEGIKHRSQLRVRGGYLQHFAAMAVTDKDIVVEVNGAGRTRANAVQLQACFRENERLRRGRNTKSLEECRQVAELFVVLKHNGSREDFFLQARDDVGVLRLGVVDRIALNIDRKSPRRKQEHDGQDAGKSP